MDLLLPSLGSDMESGILLSWSIAPGDEVSRGDVVAEIETDKGIIEIECWHHAIVEEILQQPGPDALPVGLPLARLRLIGPPDEGDGDVSNGASSTEAGEPGAAPPRARVAPRARKLAERLAIDVDEISAQRDDGLITSTDVEALARVERPGDAVARAMARSKEEIPHYYLAAPIDLSQTTAWLDEANASRPVARRLLPAVILLRAVVISAGRVPGFNGHYLRGEFQPSSSVHLGVAVSLRGGGVVAPVLRDANTMDVGTTAERLRREVMRARAGRLKVSSLTDATITVTSLGDQGVETVFPVIVPPQVAIVGFGTISEKVVSVGGTHGPFESRPFVVATLAGDHRVSDGHLGSRFLTTLRMLLQDPDEVAATYEGNTHEESP